MNLDLYILVRVYVYAHSHRLSTHLHRFLVASTDKMFRFLLVACWLIVLLNCVDDLQIKYLSICNMIHRLTHACNKYTFIYKTFQTDITQTSKQTSPLINNKMLCTCSVIMYIDLNVSNEESTLSHRILISPYSVGNKQCTTTDGDASAMRT